MFTAKQFRVKAAESGESLKNTGIPSEIREFQRSKESFSALAENEDWLANNFDKIIHSQGISAEDDDTGKSVVRSTVAETEEHILRCLGAAVIMQWNTIPTKLQRELFDTAGSMGDVLKSAGLRAQIARFLHRQKDEDVAPDCISKPSTPKGTTAWRISSVSVNSSSLRQGFFVHPLRAHMKFVTSILLRIEILASRATASKAPPKNTNGLPLKAISRCRAAFSIEAKGRSRRPSRVSR